MEEPLTTAAEVDLEPVRPGAVTDKTVRALMEMIRSGRVPPNARLPAQRALAEALDVSRTSLREAIFVLETLGYLRVEPNRGTFVRADQDGNGPMRWRLAHPYSERDIFETRFTLESYTARLAALNATDEDCETLRACIEAMKDAARERDLSGFAEADFSFHEQIVKLSGNQLVAGTLQAIKEAMKDSQRLPLAEPSRLWDPIYEHKRILTAIRQHDPDGAAYLMQLHITRAAARANIGLRL